MRVLVIGTTGQLGHALHNVVWPDHFHITRVGRHDCELTDPHAVERTVRSARADIVVNAAAYTAVDRAQSEPGLAMQINGEAPAILARCCAEGGAALIHISSDYVFDGTKAGPYKEEDAVNPQSVYGKTKLAGEIGVRANLPRHVILRASWVFSSHGSNFVKTMLRLASQGNALRVVDDQMGAPTAACDLAVAVGTIANAVDAGSAAWGTYHFASAEPVSWFGFAQAIFEAAGRMPPGGLLAISSREYAAPAPRPANSVLDCARIRSAYGIGQPSWRAALDATLSELRSMGIAW